jgi:hypothetical protein
MIFLTVFAYPGGRHTSIAITDQSAIEHLQVGILRLSLVWDMWMEYPSMDRGSCMRRPERARAITLALHSLAPVTLAPG